MFVYKFVDYANYQEVEVLACVVRAENKRHWKSQAYVTVLTGGVAFDG